MHIRPWIRSDIPVSATILAECNVTDTLSRWLSPYRDQYYTSYRRGGLLWLRREWLLPGRQAFVLVGTPEELGVAGNAEEVDQNEIIVGWAWFTRKGTSEKARYWQQTPSGAAISVERALLAVEKFVTKFIPNEDPSRDREHWAKFLSHPGEEWDTEIFAESWELDALDVDPKYQRRGYGKLLLDWVFERAREENVPICVNGSPRGGPMYRKYGFKSIGEVGFGQYFDELEFGGEPIQSWVWEPENSDGKWWERAKQKKEQQKQQQTETKTGGS